jgi:hypothetical protein
VLETVPRKEEKNWRRYGSGRPKPAPAWHTGLSGFAPDSVRCPRLAPRQTGRSRESASDVAKNHRTVRWCTGLSGGSSAPAPKSFSDELIALGGKGESVAAKNHGLSGESEPHVPTVGDRISGRRVARANGRMGTPDCPVRQRDRRPNGRMRQIRKEIKHRTATVLVRWCTGQYGAPHDRREDFSSNLISNGS